MLSTEKEAPTVDERYECAANTSDMTHRNSELPGGAPDVLAAAAWSDRRLGSALMRLCSQWIAEKPRRIEALTVKERMAFGMDREAAEASFAADRDLYAEAYSRQLAGLLARLRDLPAVRAQLQQQAEAWGMESAEAKAAEVLRFWLQQECRQCHGRKFQLLQGTPTLSNRVCPACHGSGKGSIPFGEDGRRLATYLDSCEHRAKQGLRNALQGRRKRKAPQQS